MKMITTLILGILLVSFNQTTAQTAHNQIADVAVTGKGSNEGYKYEEVRYYYYPNLLAYYDTKVGMYLYQEDGEWVESEQLDVKTRGYSLKNGQYVIIKDYLGEEPYTLIDQHRKQFPADYSSRPKKPTPGSDTTTTRYNTQDIASN